MKNKLIIWLSVAVIAVIALVALAVPSPAVQKDIGSDELLKLQAAGGASIVDVRTPPEFESGHIASSVNVPLDQLEQVSATWDKQKPVVVYCATGARSADAAAFLASHGFREVYNLTGGAAAWTGELVGGAAAAAAPSGAGSVKTNGKRLFIEFSTST
ncbi:MAG TPA: rhodanese-like domain-containing protein [Coriobacteriia bacterium]